MAIDEDLPEEFLGRRSENMPQEDFVRGTGTALSPGVKMLTVQMVATLLAGRRGVLGKVGAGGLIVLGVASTFGMLGEAITYRVLNPKTFDPPKAIVVISNILFPILMIVFGVRAMKRG